MIRMGVHDRKNTHGLYYLKKSDQLTQKTSLISDKLLVGYPFR